MNLTELNDTELYNAVLILRTQLDLKKVDLSKVYIAGGALRDTVIFDRDFKDIDIYVTDDKILEKLDTALGSFLFKKWDTEMATTYKTEDVTVQLIKILNGEPKDVVTRFDFKQNAMFMFLSDLEINTEFASLENELIVMDNIETPITMLFRLNKMLSKGFRIEKQELEKVINTFSTAINSAPYNDYLTFDRKALGVSLYDM